MTITNKQRCMPCGGSGKVMGGGMLLRDCDECDGVGKIVIANDELDYLAVKETQRYRESVEKVKAAAPEKTNEEVEAILDEAIAGPKQTKLKSTKHAH